jgi:hypothetical protein
MEINELLAEVFGRIPDHVRAAVDGLGADELHARPAPDANSIGWTVWHLTRVQDHHVADLLGEDQLWVTGDWAPRFGVGADPTNTGYGHGADQVATIRPDGSDVLIDYYLAVHERTRGLLVRLTPADLDRIVDERWDPPVTLGVRLVSIADDDIQHAGQARYIRGLLAHA